MVGDAKAILEILDKELANYEVNADYRKKVENLNKSWDQFVEDIYAEKNEEPAFQGEVIGAVNSFPSLKILCFVQQVVCRETYINCGVPETRKASIWNTVIPVWVMRLPVA